jgi:solute:Na+ symporter, SSS family
VTLATPPEPVDHLIAFYRRTRPDGPGWQPIASRAGGPPPAPIGGLLADWAAGVVLVYAVLFGIGNALLGSALVATVCFITAIVAIAVIYADLSRRGWDTITS